MESELLRISQPGKVKNNIILSSVNQEWLRNSAPLIDKPIANFTEGALLDLRMGTVKESDPCKTCGGYLPGRILNKTLCSGIHFGYIDLSKNMIYNPLFIGVTVTILNAFNFSSYFDNPKTAGFEIKCLYTKDQLRSAFSLVNVYSVKDIKDILEKLPHNTSDKITKFYSKVDKELSIIYISYDDGEIVDIKTVYQFLNAFTDENMSYLKEMKINNHHPRNYIFRYFPVLPNKERYGIEIRGRSIDNAINNEYLNILRENSKKSGADIGKIYKAIMNIISSKDEISIKGQINGKEGLVMHFKGAGTFINISRAMIIPDATNIRPDEIGLNKNFIANITVDVTDGNIGFINKIISEGAVEKVKSSDGKERYTTKIPIIGEMSIKESNVSLNSLIRNIDLIDGVAFHYPDNRKEELVFTNTINKISYIVTIESMAKNALTMDSLISKSYSYVLKVNVGDKVSRKIRNGDIIIGIRYPILSKGSIHAFVVKFLDVEAPISIHPANFSNMNADCDGDEFELILLNGENTMKEVQDKIGFSHNMTSLSNGKIVNAFIQNSIDTVFYLTSEQFKFREGEVKHIWDQEVDLVSCRKRGREFPQGHNVTEYWEHLLKKYGIKPDSGRALFSALLPQDMEYKLKDVQIKDGILIKGQIEKQMLYSGDRSIVHMLYHLYDPETVINFIDKTHHVCDYVMKHKGITVDYGDLRLNERSFESALRDYLYDRFTHGMVSANSGWDKLKDDLINIKINNILSGDLGSLKQMFTDSQIKEIISRIENEYMDAIISALPNESNVRERLMSMLDLTDDSLRDEFPTLDMSKVAKIDILKILESKVSSDISGYLSKILSAVREHGLLNLNMINHMNIFNEDDVKKMNEIITEKSTYYRLKSKISNIKNEANMILENINTKPEDKQKLEFEAIRRLNVGQQELTNIITENVDKRNNLKLAIESGVAKNKGDLTKIIGSVGQILLGDGSRPSSVGIVSSLDPLEQRGFCPSSFVEGVSLSSFTQWEDFAREGVVRTQTGTPVGGYMGANIQVVSYGAKKSYKNSIKFNGRIIMSSFGKLGLNIESAIKDCNGNYNSSLWDADIDMLNKMK